MSSPNHICSFSSRLGKGNSKSSRKNVSASSQSIASFAKCLPPLSFASLAYTHQVCLLPFKALYHPPYTDKRWLSMLFLPPYLLPSLFSFWQLMSRHFMHTIDLSSFSLFLQNDILPPILPPLFAPYLPPSSFSLASALSPSKSPVF